MLVVRLAERQVSEAAGVEVIDRKTYELFNTHTWFKRTLSYIYNQIISFFLSFFPPPPPPELRNIIKVYF